MKRFKFKWILLTTLSAVFCSCINQDYDLSDIDTTAEFRVNDFVIPMNLDKIKLESILDIPDDSKLQKMTFERDGVFVTEYAVVETGSFHSDEIDIPGFISEKPKISPTYNTLELVKGDIFNSLPQYIKRKAATPKILIAYCDIPSDTRPGFSVTVPSISEYIKSIDNIAVTAHIIVSFTLSDIEKYVNNFHIDNLVLQFPDGLEMTPSQGTYDSNSGLLTLGDITSQTPNSFKVEADVTRISGQAFDYTENSDKTHSLVFEDSVYVKSGKIAFYTTDIKSGLNLMEVIKDVPTKLSYACIADVSKIECKEFTGKVAYDVEGINIAPIEVSGIPEMLKQTETVINLTNPQIYLKINNVLSDYNIFTQAGFDFTSINGDSNKTYSLDEGKITIYDKDNVLVMSPKVPDFYYPGFENARHIGFKSLSDILDTGNGIPYLIKVDVSNPRMPEQQINNFKLGQNLGCINGEYLMYAPLNLTEKTQIIYTDTIDGWNDEDVDGIIISKLTSMFKISTDIPCTMELTINPIVIRDGKSIVDKDVFGSTTIDVDEKGIDKEVDINGKIEHLDGIVFKAVIKGKYEQTLTPEMNITIDNLKAKVTGSYTKKL